MVLLCPAWKNWGTAKTGKSPARVILHCRADDVVPFADSKNWSETASFLRTR